MLGACDERWPRTNSAQRRTALRTASAASPLGRRWRSLDCGTTRSARTRTRTRTRTHGVRAHGIDDVVRAHDGAEREELLAVEAAQQLAHQLQLLQYAPVTR